MFAQKWKKLVLHFVIIQMARFTTSSIFLMFQKDWNVECIQPHFQIFVWEVLQDCRPQTECSESDGELRAADWALFCWAGPSRAAPCVLCSVWLAAVSPLCKAPLVFSSPSTWLSHCNPVSLCQERHLLVTKFLTRGADIERDHNPFHFSLFFIPRPFHFRISLIILIQSCCM